MSSIVISPPAGDDDGESRDDAQSSNQGSSSRRSGTIPNREECLEKLARLPGMVAMKLLTPTEANTIRSILESILRHLEPVRRTPSAHLADEKVMGLWRPHPELLDHFEFLLTPEQLQEIMREVRGDAGG